MIYDTWRKYVEYLDDPMFTVNFSIDGANLTVMIDTYISHGDWETLYLGEHLAKWCCIERNDEGNTDTNIPRGWIHDLFALRMAQIRSKQDTLRMKWDAMVEGKADPCPSTMRIEY